MRKILGGLAFLVGVAVMLVLIGLGVYFFAPRSNAKLGQVDTLIVLGCPTKADGSPTPEQRERVLEAVREYKRGASEHVMMTGAAAHNHFVEAHAMALLAESQGVPAESIVEEG